MATVKELKATARPAGGKGAARAVRRAGRVPGVIYGNSEAPVTISVDDAGLRQRILAGRFLTTIYDIDLEARSTGLFRVTSILTRCATSRSMWISCGLAKVRPSESAFPCTFKMRRPRQA